MLRIIYIYKELSTYVVNYKFKLFNIFYVLILYSDLLSKLILKMKEIIFIKL